MGFMDMQGGRMRVAMHVGLVLNIAMGSEKK